MIAALTPRPQVVTRRLGDLSAIQNPVVQTVIWTRSLPRDTADQIFYAAAAIRGPLSFLSLTNDPFDRIHQQLRKAGIRSHFLVCDIALLVTVFGEISGATRVKARLNAGAELASSAAPGFRLVAVYGACRPRPAINAKSPARRFASYVAMFRGNWSQDHPLANPSSGLWLAIDPAPDLPRR